MDIRIMKACVTLARRQTVEAGEEPFAAMIVKDGKVVAEGVNEMAGLLDPTAHAEMQAIRKACEALGTVSLEGCELYTSCEPCPMCLGAIYWARPDAVYYACTIQEAAEYGFDDTFMYKELALPIERRDISMKRVLPEGYKQPFEAWMERFGSKSDL
ncbi:nucleoside deaminase [Paenibacillus sp. MBLB4367]|uniref:nucleoside deaminase n=1 Tax=Paenibacillus sp. MBLB4367 TaxID=3384767 RepID=UPI003908173F